MKLVLLLKVTQLCSWTIPPYTKFLMFPTMHISGMPIGGLLGKINRVVKFTEDEKMMLNFKKCKEMVIDFRKNKSVIPLLGVNGPVFERGKSYKLLGM